eukprot:EC789027.1.p1 GENE.EC789027.1~~EC789027.1.p1  ORF type:complete len:109 (+),score=25.56 EC789027.1:129-455(+)
MADAHDHHEHHAGEEHGGGGAAAALISSPLDVIKTYLQTQGSLGVTFRGFMDTAKYVYRNAGVSGFFQGASARALYVAPSAAISWMTYEYAKFLLGIKDDSFHHHDHH